MIRLRHAGLHLLRAAVLACLLLLVWGGGARAEFKTLKLPKSGEFQIDLDALVQEIPPFPTVVKEDDHWVFTGLEAWGLDKKYMSTFHVYIARRELGPEFVSEKDQLEDRMVVYCEDSFWEESYFPIKIGKQDGRISLSPSDPQRTMFLQFADKKDKKVTWRFYANGDVELINGKDHSSAKYENGILKEAYGVKTAGKVTGAYTVTCGGLAGGEYCYVLTDLYVSSKTVELDEGNRWNPVTGWKNPEDKQIKEFTKAELPFKFVSAAGTPFRVIAPVMAAGEEPAAEDLSAFAAAAGERRLYPTLADFGLPAFPEYETEENSVNCHVTGLSKWGAPEDELTLSPSSGAAYTYNPGIPGIREVVIWYSENDAVPSMTLYMEQGSCSIYSYRGSNTVRVSLSGGQSAEYCYLAGYLCNYTVRSEDKLYFNYEPVIALNENVLAEGLLPPIRCYSITRHVSGGVEQWFPDHGEWTGEDGPCPVDESRIPPALSWAAE